MEKGYFERQVLKAGRGLRWRARGREFKRCVSEKLLVKTLFKEVSVKTSFEGTEGRAVAENQRKRNEDLSSRAAEGTISSKTFSALKHGN